MSVTTSRIALSPLLVEGRTASSSSRWWYETVMVRGGTMGEFFILLVTLPVTRANSFVSSPGVARGDVTGSAALEWTLQSEPGRDDFVGFTFNGVDVFRYVPYTGVIPPRVIDGPYGNGNASFDPRFTIYNTSTRGVGFRLAGLRPEDAGNYTCGYESLSAIITMDAVLFVYDVPDRPVIKASPQTLVEGVTNVSLECGTSPTSFPMGYRPAMLYMWSRNGVDIDRTGPPERHAVFGDSGQTLEISPVRHTDTTYTCTASENGTQLTSEETKVTLDILHGPYNLITNRCKPSVRENELLVIVASVDCNPACSFTWSIGDDVISQETLLRFDQFQSRDANNYTVRAQNAYGWADLGVEITLDTITEVPDERPAANPSDSDNIIIGILAAVACVSITINIVFFTVAFRRGLLVCKKGDRDPASTTAVYVNSGLVREPGNPVADYVSRRTDVAYEDVTPTREHAHLSDMAREDGLDSVAMESREHHSPGVGGVYEPVDQRTREPSRPADQVYAALRNAST